MPLTDRYGWKLYFKELACALDMSPPSYLSVQEGGIKTGDKCRTRLEQLMVNVESG